MPWCPKCKNEYVEGIKECADCKVALVDNPDERKAVIFGEQEQMQKLKEFLEYSKSDDVLVEESESDSVQINYSGVYQNSAAKAEDNKSSAFTLLLVGSVGILVIILCMAGVIDLNLNTTSKYMVYGVMGALFVLFLVMGFVSLRSSRIFAEKARKEDSLTEEIRKWCLADMRAAKVDELLSEEDRVVEEEMKYFRRTEIMKKLIGEKFLNLDEAYLEHFVDEIYPEIFEKEA